MIATFFGETGLMDATREMRKFLTEAGILPSMWETIAIGRNYVTIRYSIPPVKQEEVVIGQEGWGTL